MKKLLLVVLVLFGLQTQAQSNFTECDTLGLGYVITTGTYYPFQAHAAVMPWIFNQSDSIQYNWDICVAGSCYQSPNLAYPLLFHQMDFTDTVKLCYEAITFLNNEIVNSCYTCDNLIFDGGSWVKIQQPYFCCDSITYWIDQSQGFNIGLDTSNIVHNPDSMTVYWGICTGFSGGGICYTGSGMYDYFPQITTADTVKVGYDVYIYENGSVEVCSVEEWLIFDQNSFSWVLLNNTPTSINELTFNRVNDNKIYDMLGREVNEVKIGTMYIKNGKKYIRVK